MLVSGTTRAARRVNGLPLGSEQTILLGEHAALLFEFVLALTQRLFAQVQCRGPGPFVGRDAGG
jgi:hypothetical protein